MIVRRPLSTLRQADELRYDDSGIEDSEQCAEQAQRRRRCAHRRHVRVTDREHLSERIVRKQRVATVPVGKKRADLRIDAVGGWYRKVRDFVDARPRIAGDEVSADGAEHVLGTDCPFAEQVAQNHPHRSPSNSDISALSAMDSPLSRFAPET